MMYIFFRVYNEKWGFKKSFFIKTHKDITDLNINCKKT